MARAIRSFDVAGLEELQVLPPDVVDDAVNLRWADAEFSGESGTVPFLVARSDLGYLGWSEFDVVVARTFGRGSLCAVADSIGGVVFLGAPVEVAKAVVGGIVVAVQAEATVGRAFEAFEYQAVQGQVRTIGVYACVPTRVRHLHGGAVEVAHVALIADFERCFRDGLPSFDNASRLAGSHDRSPVAVAVSAVQLPKSASRRASFYHTYTVEQCC